MKTFPSLLLLALLGACANQSGLVAVEGTDPGVTGTQPTGTEDPVGDDLDLASGIVIDKVAFYQSIEIELWEDGEAVTTMEAPIIAAKDGLLRVFVQTKSGWTERKVEGVLTIDNGDEVHEVRAKRKITENSKTNDLGSTINFDVPGELLKNKSEFEIEILETTTDAPGGGSADDVTWKSKKEIELDIVISDTLEIVLIPVKYNYDGSGRLPDTSELQQQRIRDLMFGMFPAKEVEVRVGDTLNWNSRIDPFNSWDWADILDETGRMRDRANENPNTYYYAMFEPENTLNEFCQFGCILGMSLLAYSPADPYFRASVGIGYGGMTSVETLSHEVGHAHGREHAPCGLGGQSSDRNFPYSGGEIGAWGYDVVNNELLPPNDTKDVMTYCGPQWVSDYTYFNLLDRILDVKVQPRSVMAQRPAMVLRSDGTMERRDPVPASRLEGALVVDVNVYDDRGEFVEVREAHMFPFSHAEGGLVLFEQDVPEGWTTEVLD